MFTHVSFLMKVKLIMNDAIAIDQDSTMQQAATIMKENDIGCILISGDQKIVGIITERDIAHEFADDVLYLDKPVKEIMTKDLITIDSEAHISDAAKLMVEKKIKKLPVTVNGEIHGIITDTDLIRRCVEFNIVDNLD